MYYYVIDTSVETKIIREYGKWRTSCILTHHNEFGRYVWKLGKNPRKTRYNGPDPAFPLTQPPYEQ